MIINTATKNLFFLSILIVLFLSPLVGQPGAPALQDVAGVYILSNGFTGYSITLNADGTYEKQYFTDCCQGYPAIPGTFSIAQNIIHFVVTPNSKNEAISGDFEMRLIQWGERNYLMDDKGIPNFASAINLRIEPRFSTISRSILTTGVFLRKGDELKKVYGVPLLPGKHDDLIAPPEIRLKITKSGERKKEDKFFIHQSVTTDKGSSDGVTIGMLFVKQGMNTNNSTMLWVVSVENHAATLESRGYYYDNVPDYKVGDILINW